MKINAGTIARLGALIVALINQVLAIFGKDVLPFTEDMTYQILSFVVTLIIVAINAWYNNDITKLAILSGKVLTALQDGKITEDEILDALSAAENDETNSDEYVATQENKIIQFANKIIVAIKGKFGKK